MQATQKLYLLMKYRIQKKLFEWAKINLFLLLNDKTCIQLLLSCVVFGCILIHHTQSSFEK